MSRAGEETPMAVLERTRTVLDELADTARARVARAKADASLEQVAQASRALPAHTGFPFEQALARPGTSFICECKKASPSKGVIVEDYDCLAIARDYEQAGASCISVLTEPSRFLGADAHLRTVASAVDIPCLRKDFTVDAYQIYEAKVLGASTVLLICALLSDDELARFIALADELGLSALVEAHDADEVLRATAAGARIVGVNNRDLRDFSVDLDTSMQLRALVPEGTLFVAESGIRTRADVEALEEAGADAVLVGEALMRAPDRTAALAELAGRATGAVAPTRVKICGLRTTADADAANAARPDYVGFVFAPERRRYVTPADAVVLRKRLDPAIRTVGVFVDAPVEQVAMLADSAAIDVVQLHGSEDERYISEVRRACSKPIPVVKAFDMEDAADTAAIEACSADCVLLDNGGGGTGDAFSWTRAAQVKRPYVLAGGLDTSNVASAIAQLHPFAVDASSSVETDGTKDPAKMAAFVNAVREADAKAGTAYADSAGEEDAVTSQKQTVEMRGAGVDTHAVAEKPAATHTAKQPTHTTPAPGPYHEPTTCGRSNGRFGEHGGQYIPETLMNAVLELDEAYARYKDDPAFVAELCTLLNEYAGRPSRLYHAAKMTADLGGAQIYLKREDMNHTGAHKINNVLGQALLAKKMGKTRLIAETGAGQHGVATATAAALFGMECVVFMGKTDTERQALNVYKMELLGARVVPVTTGTATLKDAVSEAFREWTSRIADTHYCLGSVMGPHPFPTMVRDFQSVISREIKDQMRAACGKLPDAVIACVGGGSNAIGSFFHFIDDPSVRLIGCEAAGRGVDTPQTAATIATGREGIFHGMKSYFCQDEFGQIAPVYSISAGLDYPGIGPEHAYLNDIGRAEYVPVTDAEAVDAFEYLSRTEGIIPAIESAHAVAYACKLAPTMSADQSIVITISGRGDKDCAAVARYRGKEISE